tara:strand:- start:879 stop:1343 length:465 start_codon:yes stop_codon:yes gene_type:complete
MKGCQDIFFNVSPLITIVIAGFLYYYVVTLESMVDCDCSKDPRRDYIKYFFGFVILYNLFVIMRGEYVKHELFIILYSAALLIQIYYLYTYVRDLEKKNCECAQGNIHEFAKYYSIFQLVFFIVVALAGVSMFINLSRCPNFNIKKELKKSLKK